MGKKKIVLFLINFLMICILPINWYHNTELDFEHFPNYNATGFTVFTSFGYAYTLFFIACMTYYLISLIRNISLNLYVCDFVMILGFSLYPYYHGWYISIAGVKGVVSCFGLGYYLAVGSLVLNMIGIIFFTKIIKKENNEKQVRSDRK